MEKPKITEEGKFITFFCKNEFIEFLFLKIVDYLVYR